MSLSQRKRVEALTRVSETASTFSTVNGTVTVAEPSASSSTCSERQSPSTVRTTSQAVGLVLARGPSTPTRRR